MDGRSAAVVCRPCGPAILVYSDQGARFALAALLAGTFSLRIVRSALPTVAPYGITLLLLPSSVALPTGCALALVHGLAIVPSALMELLS